MNRMSPFRGIRALSMAALILGALPGLSMIPREIMRASMRLNAPGRARGEPAIKRGTKSTTVAAMKRAAKKRRNVRARSSRK